MNYQTQPQEFHQLEDNDAKVIADCCPNSGWVLDFLRMMDGAAGYARNLKYLMKRQAEGAINEGDMVHLTAALRYCYRMLPSYDR